MLRSESGAPLIEVRQGGRLFRFVRVSVDGGEESEFCWFGLDYVEVDQVPQWVRIREVDCFLVLVLSG